MPRVTQAVSGRAGIEPLFLGVGADQRGEGVMKRFVGGAGGTVGS